MINRQIIGQKKSKNISRKKKPKIEKKNKDLKKKKKKDKPSCDFLPEVRNSLTSTHRPNIIALKF
jgi:hypothetical protein